MTLTCCSDSDIKQRIEDCLEEYESPETIEQSRDSFLDDSGNLDNTDNLDNSGIVDTRSAENSEISRLVANKDSTVYITEFNSEFSTIM